MRGLFVFIVALCVPLVGSAAPQFSLHKLESGLPGPTVLVVGGIQGDEPGGFHAASLLVTDYRVKRGRLWVVPNLNFESIIRRSRGVNGDMNRKFAALHSDDPDYQAVERIKALIRGDEVDYILNLHDGSGFYRERYIDRLHSPHRWGQSIIIDQDMLGETNMAGLAQAVTQRVNHHLLNDEHSYRVRNTRTSEGDAEMEKTLTYFAIRHGKPALGLEASKSLPTHQRVYYHLQLLEGVFAELGLGVERDFALQPPVVKAQIDSDLRLSLFDERIHLDLAAARRQLSHIPMKRDSVPDYSASNPLLALVPKGDAYRVSYGNRRMTLLRPQFFEYDESMAGMTMELDGVRRHVDFGSIITVGREFSAHPPQGCRVNVIGWTRSGLSDEAGQRIELGAIQQRFSVDRQGTLYRVEVYRGDKFSGMVLVRFEADTDKSYSTAGESVERHDNS